MVAKPSLDTTGPACGPEETNDVDVVGIGQPLGPPFLHGNDPVARDLAVDISETAREQSDVVRQVEEYMRYDNTSENRRADVDPMGERTGLDGGKLLPVELIIGTDAASATRPPETKSRSFSIESLLERGRTDPPSEQRTNDVCRPRNRTCKRSGQLQFQPVGFQVERLSPSAIPESASVLNTLTSNCN